MGRVLFREQPLRSALWREQEGSRSGNSLRQLPGHCAVQYYPGMEVHCSATSLRLLSLMLIVVLWTGSWVSVYTSSRSDHSLSLNGKQAHRYAHCICLLVWSCFITQAGFKLEAAEELRHPAGTITASSLIKIESTSQEDKNSVLLKWEV